MTAGRGFISLAAMIFGNWMPFGALGASLLFGYTQGLQNALLLEGVTNIPRQFISMIPYVVTIVAVSGLVGRVRAPAAEGKVYDTEGGLRFLNARRGGRRRSGSVFLWAGRIVIR